MSKFNALMLMDLHFGAINITDMMNQATNILFDHIIKSDERIDAIFIGGDLFDSKQYLSSDITKGVCVFLDTLYNITDKWNTDIYIIKGTRTHDDLQLETLQIIYARNKRFHFVLEVSEITLTTIDDYMVDILMIPEEYVLDQNEYYKDTLYNPDKKYDFIIGHGMIDKIWYAQKEHENMIKSNTVRFSAPVFPVEDLLKSANYVFFGHIHTHKHYGKNKRFQYVGPFTRWEFGTTTEVGFLSISYDLETEKLVENYIENTEAKRLKEVAISIKTDKSLTELNDYLSGIVSNSFMECDRLHLIIHLLNTLPTVLSMRQFIISKLSDMPNLKLSLIMDESESEIDSGENEIKEVKYFTKGAQLPEQVKQFLKDKKNIDMSIEDISKILKLEV